MRSKSANSSQTMHDNAEPSSYADAAIRQARSDATMFAASE